MIETNKYYTPSIEEFHVGFEFEIKSIYVEPGAEVVLEKIMSDYDNFGNSGIQHGTNWVKESLNLYYKLENINRYINQGRIRVKNLDVSDIENVGFILYKKHKRTTIAELRYQDYELTFDDTINNEWNCSITHEDSDIFSGLIKNKSELQQVLKMIGVIE